jgi:quercetin dioxygenase-like cupin family protein
MAEDAAKVAPHVYKVLFENERLRFLEVSMQPGDRTELHSHPGYFAYFLSAGASMWRDAEEHAAENTGDTAIRALFFEPK